MAVNDESSAPVPMTGIATRMPDGRPRRPDEIEREWRETVYRGAGDTMPQLTPRSILMGAFLGGILSLTNLYVALKIGWTSGVAITACILSFSIWRTLRAAGLVRSDFGILENNCMQSTATAAGYSVGGTMASAIAAMLMITGQQMDFWALLGWNVCLAVIGVAMAVPMKRQMINIEQLPFPSGTAAAETLRSLHMQGSGAMQGARALGIAGLFGAGVAWLRDATFTFMPWNLPAALPFGSLSVAGIPLAGLSLRWDLGLVTVGAGALVGLRVGWSLLVGALLNYLVLAPWMAHLGVITAADPARGIGFPDIARWSLWSGVPIMVVSSLVSLAFGWRTAGRALSGLGLRRDRRAKREDPLAAIEVPPSWFWGLFLIGAVGVIIMQRVVWDIPILMGTVAVLLTFVLSVVACRATGETDTTPTGALGKVTQLTYGVLSPSNMTTNIMTASVTANAAGCAADLLTDLKSGYLLGANARKQFIAQLMGILPGAVCVGLGWALLVPNAEALGTERFPAAMAVVWKGVAELLSHGLGSLPPTARLGALVSAALGLLLPLLERAFPRARAFIPSPMGLGLAFVMPGYISISMFAGALLAAAVGRWRARAAREYVVPVASGLIAGESLMAVLISALMALGVAQK
jgi:uncharacterized oligopeptide transporter (OPT) family protein